MLPLGPFIVVDFDHVHRVTDEATSLIKPRINSSGPGELVNIGRTHEEQIDIAVDRGRAACQRAEEHRCGWNGAQLLRSQSKVLDGAGWKRPERFKHGHYSVAGNWLVQE